MALKILTSTSFLNLNFRQATAEKILYGHKWSGMFMGNKVLFVAGSSRQLCFHTRGVKNSICTHAIPNSIARCLNVNIYWAVTFLQQITVWSSVNSWSFLFKASFSAKKYRFVGKLLINVLCFSSVSKQVCTVFKIQKQGIKSQSNL